MRNLKPFLKNAYFTSDFFVHMFNDKILTSYFIHQKMHILGNLLASLSLSFYLFLSSLSLSLSIYLSISLSLLSLCYPLSYMLSQGDLRKKRFEKNLNSLSRSQNSLCSVQTPINPRI